MSSTPGKTSCSASPTSAGTSTRRPCNVLGNCPEKCIQARTEETLSNTTTFIRSLYVATAPKGYKGWEHIRSIFRVHSQAVENGVVISEENRYLVSSKEPQSATPLQWLNLIRARWGVENNLHWTLDAIFKEDDRPWILASPRGALTIAILRRAAYSLLALFRSVTLRSDEARSIPWRELLTWVYDTLIAAADDILEGLRHHEPHKPSPAPS